MLPFVCVFLHPLLWCTVRSFMGEKYVGEAVRDQVSTHSDRQTRKIYKLHFYGLLLRIENMFLCRDVAL